MNPPDYIKSPKRAFSDLPGAVARLKRGDFTSMLITEYSGGVIAGFGGGLIIGRFFWISNGPSHFLVLNSLGLFMIVIGGSVARRIQKKKKAASGDKSPVQDSALDQTRMALS